MPRPVHARKPRELSKTARPPTETGPHALLRPGLVVAIVALLARLTFLAEYANNPTFNQPIVDAQLYDATARAFVQSGNMGFGFFWQPCFYPLVLSVIYALSDCSMLAARIAQLLIGTVTCILVYHLGRRIFDRRVGLVAGLITALYGPLIYAETELVGAGWAAFAAAALVLVLLRAAQRRSVPACFVAGIGGAVSVIIRPTFLGFFLAASAYLIVVLIRRRQRWVSMLAPIAAGALGFALIAVPVVVQCKAVAGYYSLLPAAGGLNMYIGNNPDTAYTLTVRPGDEWTELQNEAVYAGCQTPLSRSRFFYGRVRDFVVSQPLAYFQGLFHKTAQFLGGREVPRNTDIYVFREWSTLLSALVWRIDGFGFPWTPVAALTAVGLVFRWRQVPVLVKLFVLLVPAAIVLVFVADRYRLETVPVFAVLAAAGAVGIVQQYRARMWRPAVLGSGLAVLVALVTSLPRPAPEERINYASEMFVLLADTVHERNSQQAVTWYEEALRREPDCERAHCHLGVLLARQHQLPQALRHFEQALLAEPCTPLARALAFYERGRALMGAQKLDDALADFNAALAAYPRLTRALCRRGEVLYKLGRTAEASEDWHRVLETSIADAEKRYAQARLDRLTQPPSDATGDIPGDVQ